MSIGTLTVTQLQREIAAARAANAGDDYIGELERILADKQAASTRDTEPPPEVT